MVVEGQQGNRNRLQMALPPLQNAKVRKSSSNHSCFISQPCCTLQFQTTQIVVSFLIYISDNTPSIASTGSVDPDDTVIWQWQGDDSSWVAYQPQ